jgi:hypothetical protein
MVLYGAQLNKVDFYEKEEASASHPYSTKIRLSKGFRDVYCPLTIMMLSYLGAECVFFTFCPFCIPKGGALVF